VRKSDPTTETYDQFAAQIAERLWKADVSELSDAFCALIPPNAIILDAGCGPGRDSARFNSLGHWSVGLDLSIGMLLEAVQLSDGDFVQGNMTALPFPPASFDAAWVAASLLHLPRDAAPGVLTEIHTILKPEGLLFLALKKGEGEVWEQREGLRLFTFYQDEEIARLLDQARFAVEKLWTNSTPKQDWINVLARKV
jgi:SAM-dependent methyltransferase